MLYVRTSQRLCRDWETGKRTLVCLVFFFVSSLGPFALAGATESETRAEAACEWSLEEVAGHSRIESRIDRSERPRDFGCVQTVRLAGHRLFFSSRIRGRSCETAPLALRC